MPFQCFDFQLTFSMLKIKMISCSLIQFVLLISILTLFAVDRAESDDTVSFVQHEDTNPDHKPASHVSIRICLLYTYFSYHLTSVKSHAIKTVCE